MKKIFFIIILVLTIFIPHLAEARKRLAVREGANTFAIWHERLRRTYLVHVPPSYDGKTPVAVVLNFHGGGGNAATQEKVSGMNDLADREGFIVVYPQGYGKTFKGKVIGGWNAGSCCPPDPGKRFDDIGFVKKLLRKLTKDFSIDKNRIYATGISNGALFSYRLACELSKQIAAIAPVAGQGVFDECQPARPVPIIHFHGKEDPCALYTGGTCGGCFSEFLARGGVPNKIPKWSCESIPAYIEKWKDLNGCTDESTVTLQKDKARCLTYDQCRGGAEVMLCTLDDMGHTWPGQDHGIDSCVKNKNSRACRLFDAIVGKVSYDINANELMWAFFKKHSLSK